MSKILNLDCDILITYSSAFNKNYNWHGLCGHIFEVFDYYFILKNHFKVKCLIPELLNDKNFFEFVESHYSVKFNKEDFILNKNYNLIKCKNILVTDGTFCFLNNSEVNLLGKIFAFSCGDSYFKRLKIPKHVTFLSDFKIYPGLGIDYTKKILPYLKHIPGDREFAHITKNCKKYDPSELIKKYPNILIYSDYLNTNDNITHNQVKNFNFSKYIYTPVEKRFDCSPRLIIECQILGIPFELWNIDYKDPGLERRLENYNQFILNDNDEIINIFKNLLIK